MILDSDSLFWATLYILAISGTTRGNSVEMCSVMIRPIFHMTNVFHVILYQVDLFKLNSTTICFFSVILINICRTWNKRI